MPSLQVRNWVTLCVTALFVSGLVSEAAAATVESDVYFNVSVRGTGSATIHARVFSNTASRNGTTVLAVHGLTETGSTFGPLARAMFADARVRPRVQRVVAIDLPGHGQSSTPSGLPAGVTFGSLTIDDNVGVVIQAIDTLRAQGLGARVIMGHSMGGLAVQAAQERLLSQGSSLARHGIFGAILLAPVPPHGNQWTRGPDADLSPFVVNDPVLGSFLSLPPPVWIAAGGYTTLGGAIVANAPTPAEVVANQYAGKEPLTTVLQLVEATVPLPTPPGGTITLQRPSVRQGAFALRNATLLSVVSFSQDVLVPAGDLDDLYVYLIGRPGLLYRPIVADDAVHSMFVSNPSSLIDALLDVF